MPRNRPTLALALLVLAACADAGAPLLAPADATASLGDGNRRALLVSSAADAGAGSFRAAIDEANADPSVTEIRLSSGLGTIASASPLVYSGPQAIAIVGGGAVVDASAAGGDGLVLAAHSAVSVRDLTVRSAQGNGISVLVDGAATGIVNVVLTNVEVQGNGGHGVLVNDQVDYLSNPDATTNGGSDATLHVEVTGSRFIENGFSALDRDGLRLNEGGLGDLDVQLNDLVVRGNGGDGIELDERSEGSALFKLRGSTLTGNGSFSAEDYDDGIDVDELDAGDLRGAITNSTISDNWEQGVDLNENHAGHLVIAMTDVVASGNAEEGIEFEEDDDFAGGGDLVATLVRTTTNGNARNDGDAGLKLREKGDGNVDAHITGAISNGNTAGGILIREDAGGNLTTTVRDAVANQNAGHGIQYDENGNGVLSGKLIGATANQNTSAGVQAEQATSGTGSLVIAGLSASGNTSGAVVANAAQVTVTILP